ncbi:tRNA glutamyl-Q(34) synthetase GluQRS [Stakelama sp. CBK3Z-3]|uniref:tRNA glutamyl-Q(34) synthetase GluQRS n=1 Tax=Stakelama flava TaxID=2860338 RepID=A0ABS6XLG2_9SPHN|nr:tRNA glutamyl-Q(34) synthetase GluQRS [Stakelama flava]
MTHGQALNPHVAVVTRFAPSPTGRLHAGHGASAIAAHDFARSRGGRFVLRIEDIDGTRSRREHVDAILADLRWLGLTWDGPVLFQSQHLAAYDAALDTLRDKRLLYPCFCTRKEIAREVAESMAAPHHGPDGPVYPGTCRSLTPEARAAGIATRPHCWRLDMAKASVLAGPLEWTDHGQGVRADPQAHGDVVLARKDAPASYHLAVTIDDAAQGVSDIIRGKDLYPATHVHRLLQALLGLPVPRYHHHALVTDARGERLAKRNGAPSLESLRLAGTDGAAVAAELRAGRVPLGIADTTP